eukprot:CAMPEP_0203672128 /NCGR_PEP_ID=MMETSP0090-20130426/7728_1 /ASSEMBLY_ACC=CAM_ASM_001088 /TAXON_ID=426623 /ORGANISM="Chaetoceros affinis, Strain CCMP159" /LENGTH=204 /DNA_ID=CAMNT_0050537381 /DNA_START=145 /DNA_END=759 /DNA_ORIENTATION=+
MEHLKSGDVPALVTNLELMNILSKRLTIRREEEEAAATLEHGSSSIENINSTKRKNSKLRHRDHIENSVYEYLAYSACANADIKKMPEIVSKLRGRHNGSKGTNKSSEPTSSDKPPKKLVKTEEGIAEIPVQTLPISTSNEVNNEDNSNQGYGLTDAETLQVLNLMPTEPVEIHLMIEDLSNRLDEDEQNSMLELISQYSGLQK